MANPSHYFYSSNSHHHHHHHHHLGGLGFFIHSFSRSSRSNPTQMGCMKNGLSLLLLLLKSPQMGVSGFSSSVATMGCRRFFQTTTESLVKWDMFRSGDIPSLFSGRQTRECIGSLVPCKCNKSHMLPYFARSLASSSVSQSSGQTSQQEPKEEKKCQTIRSSELQRERSCDETYSTKVSLNQFPGLMVHGMVENSKTRRLLRLNPGTGYFEQEEQDVAAAAANHDHSQHNELQVPHGHVCRGSAYGWLFLTDDNLDMKLLNPFSGAEIQLPPMNTLPRSNGIEEEEWPLSKWFVSKAVFSANPSVEPRPVVLVIYAGERTPRLAFCKPGDETWTPLGFPIKTHFDWCFVFPMDAIYHKGQFYVLGLPGYVAAFDIGRRINDEDHSVKTTLVATAAKRKPNYMRDSFLAVLDGAFVRIELRTSCFHDCCIYGFYDGIMEVRSMREDDTTDGIKIWRFDESEKQWVRVESLGDKAVFLGYNTSFALSASDCPAGLSIPNSIYYTYGEGGYARTEKVYYDMGIYDVKDKSVKPLYLPMYDDSGASQFKMPAPIWIVNSADS